MLNLKIFCILSIIFTILSDCRIKVGSQQILFCSICFMVLFALLFTKKHTILNKIYFFIRKTPLKILLAFLVWTLLVPIFSTYFSTFPVVFIRTILYFTFIIFPAILFPIYFIPKYISYKALVKIFAWVYLFVLLYGIFDFIGQITSNSIILNIHNIICTRAYFLNQTNFDGYEIITNRARSVFFEPSFLALFLFTTMPLIYKITSRNFEIFKNINFNIIFKKSLIILLWVNILLTQSPIYIIATIIFSFVYYFKTLLKHKAVLTLILVIISIFAMSSIFQDDDIRVFRRINKVTQSLQSIDNIIFAEPSLGTRIVVYINSTILVKNHLFTGITSDNEKQMYNQLKNSPVPLTLEIIEKMETRGLGSPPSIFWGTLLENGLIGIFILYTFFIITIKRTWDTRVYFTNDTRKLLEGCSLTGVNYIINSIYQSFFVDPFLWFIFGLLISFWIEKKNLISKQK